MVSNFKEARFDFPFIIKKKLVLLNFAVPYPELRLSAYNHLGIKLNSNFVKTEELMNVDRSVIAEYKQRFPFILSKAISSTIAKTIAQYKAQKEMGQAGATLGLLYSLMSSNADLRSWHTLPKNVQIASVELSEKLEKNETSELLIYANDDIISRVQIPNNNSSILYIRIPSANAKPSISVFNL